MKRLASEWTLAWLLVGLGALGGTAGCDDTDEPGGSGGNAGTAGAAGSAGSANAGTSSGGTHSGGTASGGTHSGGTSMGGKGGAEPTGGGGADAVGGEAGQTQGGAAGEAGGGAGGVGGDDTAGAGGEAPCVPRAPTLPLNVPAIIGAPIGATLVRHFHAVGTQNYVCKKGDGDAYSWVFVAPVAELSNSCGAVVGHHFAAPGTAPPVPVWKYDADGSSVKGKRLQAVPVNGAIPELLLGQDGHEGAGLFANITFVQRLATVGGLAPAADACNAQHENEAQNIAYTAEYYFYTGGD